MVCQFVWGSSSKSRKVAFIGWEDVYLNTDGSVRLEVDSALGGGIVRDKVGNWIFDFNRFLGTCLVFEVELWGILDGLDILIDRGYDNVLVQTDSLEVATAEADRLVKLTHLDSQGLQVFEVSPFGET
ncbi:hypothetical protein Goklo_024049, partial [Gossypium klotzschianum]|nr:hypothetical protein [Gossypium klotzschianum]